MRPLYMNNLEVRLARTEAEIDASQALRYRVFYDEMGAQPTPANRRAARDVDPYDEFCDHLLVIDLARSTVGNPQVVGSYRLLRGDVADRCVGFYSKNEYDLAPLTSHSSDTLELGRSCIDADYRSRGTIQLLWRGLAQYISDHAISHLFGCASLPGVDPQALKLPLSYLHHNHLAPKAFRTRALDELYVDMNMMAKAEIDTIKALRELPPLIKGYLRVGGHIGEGAVIDHQFNTVDVNIIVETQAVTQKYLDHYTRKLETFDTGALAGRKAALSKSVAA